MPDWPPRPGTSRAEEATVVVRRGSANLLSPGSVLGRTFKIDALVSRSATGNIYYAKHIELGTPYAIKVVPARLADDPHLAALLAKLGRVRDDAVAAYEGVLRDEGTLRYIVMEFVGGERLAEILEQRRLEPDEILRLRDRLAKALAAAHQQGVTHRALSLDKILLPSRFVERAKIVGFSLSNATEAVTRAPTPPAEYAFLAPEQLGLFGGTVDGRSDIYSLGLILAAAAIGGGKRLYMGSDAATAIGSRQRVPDLSLVPVSLRPVIAPMLEPRPERRWSPAPTSPEPVRPAPPAPVSPAPPPRVTAQPPETPPQPSRPTGPPRERPQPQREATPSPQRKAAPSRGRTAPPRVQAARKPAGRKLMMAGIVAILLGAGAFGALHLLWPAPQHPPDMQAALAAAATGYKCAAITYDLAADHSVRLAGHVSSAQDLERLRNSVTGIPNIGEIHFNVGVMAWPDCEVSATLAGLISPPGRDAPALSLGTKNAHPGDRLVVDGHAPAFDGYVYVDYYGSDGQVVHLLPTARDRFNLKPLRNHFVLGCPPTGVAVALEKPPGQRLITLIATSKPLFPDLRPGTEPARDYLGSLVGAIHALGTTKTAAALSFFDLEDGSGSAAPAAACPAK
jgi:eukaryotic-like serine/threonine-protein kinase